MTDKFLPNMSFEDRNGPEGCYKSSSLRDILDDDTSLVKLEFDRDFVGDTHLWPPNKLATNFTGDKDPNTRQGHVEYIRSTDTK